MMHSTLHGTSDERATIMPTIPNDEGTSMRTPAANAHHAAAGGNLVDRRNAHARMNRTHAPRN